MDKKFLKISVITPSFNQGKYIEETIKSVLNQNYPNLEYIIVDGGSGDNTVDVLKKYKNSIIYISESDNGQADAVNKGFRMCTGEIIGWINSDDTYKHSILDKINIFFLKNKDVYMVYGDCDKIDQFDNRIGKEDVIDFDYEVLRQKRCFIPQMTVFFRREVLTVVGYLSLKYNYSMDYEYWLRISKDFKVMRLPFTIANFRIYPGTKSYRKSFSQLKENLIIKYTYEGISKLRFYSELLLWRLIKIIKK